jgi:prevent-host-death family protein
MQINVTEAKGLLLDLVRRAEAGEEVILSRHGEPVVRLTPVRRPGDPETRRRALEAARGCLKGGPPAARSQDFLYDERGFPA